MTWHGNGSHLPAAQSSSGLCEPIALAESTCNTRATAVAAAALDGQRHLVARQRWAERIGTSVVATQWRRPERRRMWHSARMTGRRRRRRRGGSQRCWLGYAPVGEKQWGDGEDDWPKPAPRKEDGAALLTEERWTSAQRLLCDDVASGIGLRLWFGPAHEKE
jgi:hypothetical protein